MLKDGLYELLYRSETEPESGFDSLILALRDGNLLGSDRWGGVFLGRCDFDRTTQRHSVQVRLQIPPGGMLITDKAPRSSGGAVDVTVTFGDNRDSTTRTGLIDVAGHPVRVELRFKGPIPN